MYHRLFRRAESVNWVVLFLAGLMEVGWAVSLKYTEGWTKLIPSIITAGFMVASFLLLSQVLKTLPIGTAYAVWTGIGVIGTTLLGMLLFGESREVTRLLCVLLILIGIVGLRLLSPPH